AAYNRHVNLYSSTIVKISTNGTYPEVFQCEKMDGGIACYSDTEFIALDYEITPVHYSKTPKFYIGELKNGNFEVSQTFCVKNPIYEKNDTKDSNILQDIHYTPEHGLFFIPLTNGEKRICRVTPEQIEAADETTP